jgi:cyclopropane-fatty-acyl-phospholipid synthase
MVNMLIERRLGQWADDIRRNHPVPLRVKLWDGRVVELGPAAAQEPAPLLHIPSISALRHILPPTLASLGRAYVEGEIDVEGRLSDVIDAAWGLAKSTVRQGEGLVRRMAKRFRHTAATDKRDIEYHYDVGNDFYRPWLGEDMIYSCAYFARDDMTLEEAQRAKLDHILTKLQVQPGDRLLDVGSGWGALVLRAAEKYGAVCHGVTLSAHQYEHATRLVRERGLASRVTIELRDYRDLVPGLEGRFDRIASVGMFEHVGVQHLTSYFSILRRLLRDGGTMLNHGIASTHPNDGATPFDAGDFIGQYVFPHGELPHVSTVLKSMQEAELESCDVESLRRHYARTLSIWAARFERHGDELRRLAGEKRCRIWRIYLAGCARAFADDWVTIYQVLACKAGVSGMNTLPMTRDWIYAGGREHDNENGERPSFMLEPRR